MGTLIFANTDTTTMAPCAESLSDDFLRVSAAAAKRMVWLTGNKDVILTPTLITSQFLSYVARLRGLQANIYSISKTDELTPRPLPFCSGDALENSRIVEFLKDFARLNNLDNIEPYIADDVATAFGSALGNVPVSFNGRNSYQANPSVTTLLNDKALFREFAPDLDVPLAPGATCTSSGELVEKIVENLKFTGTVILKLARHSGADGNFIISASQGSDFRGADRFYLLCKIDTQAVKSALRELGLKPDTDQPVIVESYYRNDATLGIHYEVDQDKYRLMGLANIMLNPGFGGSYWGAELTDEIPESVFQWSNRLANFAQKQGHQGPLSVDIIKNDDIGFIACEVNGRHGGFSTVRGLVGSLNLIDSIDSGERVVLARNRVDLPVNFEQLRAALKVSKLDFCPAAQEGVVIMVEGFHDQGPYDLVFIAPTKEMVLSMEDSFLQFFRKNKRNIDVR